MNKEAIRESIRVQVRQGISEAVTGKKEQPSNESDDLNQEQEKDHNTGDGNKS